MEQKTKRTIAKEILIAVGICIGGAIGTIVRASYVPDYNTDDDPPTFFAVVAACYVIRLIAWAVKVLNSGKQQQ